MKKKPKVAQRKFPKGTKLLYLHVYEVKLKVHEPLCGCYE